jgi:hypothetical protein
MSANFQALRERAYRRQHDSVSPQGQRRYSEYPVISDRLEKSLVIPQAESGAPQRRVKSSLEGTNLESNTTLGRSTDMPPIRGRVPPNNLFRGTSFADDSIEQQLSTIDNSFSIQPVSVNQSVEHMFGDMRGLADRQNGLEDTLRAMQWDTLPRVEDTLRKLARRQELEMKGVYKVLEEQKQQNSLYGQKITDLDRQMQSAFESVDELTASLDTSVSNLKDRTNQIDKAVQRQYEAGDQVSTKNVVQQRDALHQVSKQLSKFERESRTRMDRAEAQLSDLAIEIVKTSKSLEHNPAIQNLGEVLSSEISLRKKKEQEIQVSLNSLPTVEQVESMLQLSTVQLSANMEAFQDKMQDTIQESTNSQLDAVHRSLEDFDVVIGSLTSKVQEETVSWREQLRINEELISDYRAEISKDCSEALQQHKTLTIAIEQRVTDKWESGLQRNHQQVTAEIERFQQESHAGLEELAIRLSEDVGTLRNKLENTENRIGYTRRSLAESIEETSMQFSSMLHDFQEEMETRVGHLQSAHDEHDVRIAMVKKKLGEDLHLLETRFEEQSGEIIQSIQLHKSNVVADMHQLNADLSAAIESSALVQSMCQELSEQQVSTMVQDLVSTIQYNKQVSDAFNRRWEVQWDREKREHAAETEEKEILLACKHTLDDAVSYCEENSWKVTIDRFSDAINREFADAKMLNEQGYLELQEQLNALGSANSAEHDIMIMQIAGNKETVEAELKDVDAVHHKHHEDTLQKIATLQTLTELGLEDMSCDVVVLDVLTRAVDTIVLQSELNDVQKESRFKDHVLNEKVTQLRKEAFAEDHRLHRWVETNIEEMIVSDIVRDLQGRIEIDEKIEHTNGASNVFYAEYLGKTQSIEDSLQKFRSHTETNHANLSSWVDDRVVENTVLSLLAELVTETDTNATVSHLVSETDTLRTQFAEAMQDSEESMLQILNKAENDNDALFTWVDDRVVESAVLHLLTDLVTKVSAVENTKQLQVLLSDLEHQTARNHDSVSAKVDDCVIEIAVLEVAMELVAVVDAAAIANSLSTETSTLRAELAESEASLQALIVESKQNTDRNHDRLQTLVNRSVIDTTVLGFITEIITRVDNAAVAAEQAHDAKVLQSQLAEASLDVEESLLQLQGESQAAILELKNLAVENHESLYIWVDDRTVENTILNVLDGVIAQVDYASITNNLMQGTDTLNYHLVNSIQGVNDTIAQLQERTESQHDCLSSWMDDRVIESTVLGVITDLKNQVQSESTINDLIFETDAIRAELSESSESINATLQEFKKQTETHHDTLCCWIDDFAVESTVLSVLLDMLEQTTANASVNAVSVNVTNKINHQKAETDAAEVGNVLADVLGQLVQLTAVENQQHDLVTLGDHAEKSLEKLRGDMNLLGTSTELAKQTLEDNIHESDVFCTVQDLLKAVEWKFVIEKAVGETSELRNDFDAAISELHWMMDAEEEASSLRFISSGVVNSLIMQLEEESVNHALMELSQAQYLGLEEASDNLQILEGTFKRALESEEQHRMQETAVTNSILVSLKEDFTYEGELRQQEQAEILQSCAELHAVSCCLSSLINALDDAEYQKSMESVEKCVADVTIINQRQLEIESAKNQRENREIRKRMWQLSESVSEANIESCIRGVVSEMRDIVSVDVALLELGIITGDSIVAVGSRVDRNAETLTINTDNLTEALNTVEASCSQKTQKLEDDVEVSSTVQNLLNLLEYEQAINVADDIATQMSSKLKALSSSTVHREEFAKVQSNLRHPTIKWLLEMDANVSEDVPSQDLDATAESGLHHTCQLHSMLEALEHQLENHSDVLLAKADATNVISLEEDIQSQLKVLDTKADTTESTVIERIEKDEVETKEILRKMSESRKQEIDEQEKRWDSKLDAVELQWLATDGKVERLSGALEAQVASQQDQLQTALTTIHETLTSKVDITNANETEAMILSKIIGCEQRSNEINESFTQALQNTQDVIQEDMQKTKEVLETRLQSTIQVVEGKEQELVASITLMRQEQTEVLAEVSKTQEMAIASLQSSMQDEIRQLEEKTQTISQKLEEVEQKTLEQRGSDWKEIQDGIIFLRNELHQVRDDHAALIEQKASVEDLSKMKDDSQDEQLKVLEEKALGLRQQISTLNEDILGKDKQLRSLIEDLEAKLGSQTKAVDFQLESMETSVSARFRAQEESWKDGLENIRSDLQEKNT